MTTKTPKIDIKALETITKKVLAYGPSKKKKRKANQPSTPDTSTASQ